MPQITRDNHFVPQFYLKQWSKNGTHIWTYRTLVSHQSIPEWKLRAIRGVAFQRDLYTSIENGEEIDEFERWIEANYEQPVQESIQKIVKNKNLTNLDWERLALFVAAQDVRTPTSYLESMKRWEKSLPKLLEDTLQESVKRLEQLQQENQDTQQSVVSEQQVSKVRLNIKPEIIVDKEQGFIQAEIVAGRHMWLESQKLWLTRTAKVLPTHKWSIVEPAQGFEWITSDHPVVRLNHYGSNSYDLKGGWGNKGTNLIMPISPKHLLFTQIGDEFPDRFTLPTKQTEMLQSYLAERALRWIFSRKRQTNVTKYRPRHVDLKAVQEEKDEWSKWHKEQSASEKISESE